MRGVTVLTEDGVLKAAWMAALGSVEHLRMPLPSLVLLSEEPPEPGPDGSAAHRRSAQAARRHSPSHSHKGTAATGGVLTFAVAAFADSGSQVALVSAETVPTSPMEGVASDPDRSQHARGRSAAFPASSSRLRAYAGMVDVGRGDSRFRSALWRTRVCGLGRAGAVGVRHGCRRPVWRGLVLACAHDLAFRGSAAQVIGIGTAPDLRLRWRE